jgi:peptidoglycan/LPS O-acetylase OafA/YrhL
MPGLDGVRAMAVLAVIAFHSGFSWLPGGFYGVDAFFALSGYLITSLLVAQWQRDGTISLGSFWARRARRLLPALFVMLAGVGVLALVWPSALDSPGLRLDTLATLFYVANWHFILVHANYFYATGQPSPLLHTWSLAIEEQFYLVWPVVLLGVLVGWRRRPLAYGQEAERAARDRRRLVLLGWICIAGALASAAEMALITHAGGDPTRAYYGTDTRAQSLLVGAAVAVGLWLYQPGQSKRGRVLLAWTGVAGVLGTAAIWALVPESSTLAFHGGFMLSAMGTSCVVACVSQVPSSVVSQILASWPLRTLGKISYGVYLWYWPTLLVVNEARTHLSGYSLFGVRLVVVIGIATLSYGLLEMPIRRGSLERWGAALAAPLGAAAVVATVFATTAVLATPALAAPVLRPNAFSNTSAEPVDAPLAAVAGGGGPRQPVKVLLVGDSIAGTLGVGMQQVQSAYDVELVNEGHPGCSLGAGSLFKVLWYTLPPGPPCSGGTPTHLLAAWRSWVDRFNPDVSIYVARTDLFDQSIDGRFEHVGEPAYDTLLARDLQRGVDVLSSRGGKVVLLDGIHYDSGKQPDGAGWPEDNPSRVVAYDKILSQVAKRNPRTVTLVDISKLVSPHGSFATRVAGVPLRCGDGVHFTVSGGRWLGTRLLARIADLGASHLLTSPSGSWPDYHVSAPSWFSKLPCGQ